MNTPNFSFETFFDLTPDLVCVAGYDGYFKKINPAVSNLLEYSLEELYSKPIDDFVHPEDRSITQIKREGLKERKPLINFENRYLSKSGKTFLTIQDNGEGMDMEYVKGKLFGMNQTFHQHADSKGIGLYLIYNHIKSVGGNIEVESEIAKGSKFTITF